MRTPLLLACCLSVVPWPPLKGGLVRSLLAQDLLVEKLQENDDEHASESALLEWSERPFDLHDVSREELLRLPFLSLSQIDSFLQARQVRRRWSNMDEALSALGVSGDTLSFCRKIFRLAPANTTPVKIASRVRIVRPATRADDWLGAGYRNYENLRAAIGAVSIATVAERDPGEKSLADLHLFALSLPVRWKRVDMQLLAGDYFVEWGQGLALWGPYGQRAGSSANAPVRRQARGLRPYLAADEDFALRGAALHCKSSIGGLLLFASRTRLDATLRDPRTVTLSGSGGLHRTDSEQQKKDRLGEETRGAAAYLTGRALEGTSTWLVGALLYGQKFDHAVEPHPESSHHFDFRGSHDQLFSLFGEWAFHQCVVAAEWAGRAFQATFEAEAQPLFLAGALWSYAPDFHSSRGRAFGAFSTSPQNQQGQYLGMRLALSHRLSLESYFQLRRSHWRTPTVPLPTQARDFGLTVEWSRAGWHLRMRLRHKTQEQSVAAPANAGNPILIPQQIHSLLFEIRQTLSPKLLFLTRLDLHRQKPATAPGFALSQEAGWRPRHKLQLFARLSIFEVRSGEAIYLYERDLPGLVTNFALRGQGQRGYVLCSIEPWRGVQLSARCSRIWRPGAARAGDGFSWSAQVDWQIDRSTGRQPDIPGRKRSR